MTPRTKLDAGDDRPSLSHRKRTPRLGPVTTWSADARGAAPPQIGEACPDGA